MTGLSVGDKVRVTRLDLDEWNSVGEIVADDDGMFLVNLDRTSKPFRGWYLPSELTQVSAGTTKSTTT